MVAPIDAKDMRAWKISYNHHMDLFQIFNESVFYTPDSKLVEQNVGDATLLCSKTNNRPMLVQFKNAYVYLGDIDNMGKADIIRAVIGYLESYGKTNQATNAV